jgi:hypothetical protein
MAENVLNVPVPRPRGTQCCCGACHANAGCSMGSSGGIAEARLGFYGICCRCVPQYACIELIVDYGTCGIDGEPMPPVTVEWDNQANRYFTSFVIPGRQPIDIAIGFEQKRGTPTAASQNDPCSLVLASECMGYRRESFGGIDDEDEDSRLFVPLREENDYTEYGDHLRRDVCAELDVTFDIDLARCDESGYTDGSGCPAQIHIRAADFVSRPAMITGFWDGYEDCRYTRVCIRYENEYERLERTVCADEYGTWIATFPDVEGQDELTVAITPDSFNPPILSLETYGLNDYEMQASCPDMRATWTLDSGATITIIGDKKADCNDCRCWPRCLCVEFANTGGVGAWRGEVCWVEDDYGDGAYVGTLTDLSLFEYEPIEVTIGKGCDECTGQSYLEYTHGSRTGRVYIECPLPSGAFDFIEDDESVTYLQFTSKTCADCFTAPGNITDCCENAFPDQLIATFSPAHHDPLDDMSTPCGGATGQIALQFYPYDSGGNFVPVWRGSGFPFTGCPEKLLTLEFACNDNYPLKFQLSAEEGGTVDPTNFILSVEESCDPVMAVFLSSLTTVDGFTCCDESAGFTAYDFKITITE